MSTYLESKFYVVRLADSRIDSARALEIVLGSLLQTKYQYRVDDPCAPSVTNCVTAVRYLFKRTLYQTLPCVFIGDMPRVLVTRHGFTIQQIELPEMRCGDLIFFRQDIGNQTHPEKRYIAHIAIALSSSVIFHSSETRGKGALEDLAKPRDKYAKNMLKKALDQPFVFLRYIDPRNRNLRTQFGEFLPFSIPRPLSHPESSQVLVQK